MSFDLIIVIWIPINVETVRKYVKEIIPIFLQDLLANMRYRKSKSRFYNLGHEEVFNMIYQENYWKNEESLSGPGSTIEATRQLRDQIKNTIVDLRVRSMLDLPCGDFNWMRYVDLENVEYTGADIVSDLVSINHVKYADRNIRFVGLDLLVDELPAFDLILVRDCFVHSSYDQIKYALNNIIKSGSKYLLTTTFKDLRQNRDIVNGDWRPLNLQINPIKFSEPLLIIPERGPVRFCKENRGKCLGLWKISDLSLLE